ncbi:synaptotagmin-2 [Myripristis murdjan]|uniref:synaptotagmin-2 n=1 Tax=Myripristis murdjan TaxID=586833 RepID=UPI001175FF3D|nr:synaptotagmin-2-like [Myripristis murdjan]XP_029909917.1 synaptotagmin-2-like [Myripristis murdjan]
MVMPIDYQAFWGQLHAAGELRIPLSEPVKYCILGISVTLLLLALGILLWQAIRCCTQTHTLQHTMNSGLLHFDDKPSISGNYSGAPSTKVEDVGIEARRLSRCLSLGSFPSSGSSQTEGGVGEQANLEKAHGSLHFSLYYDRLQSRLVVTVLQAEGLQGRSQTQSLHPFVRLSLMSTGSEGVDLEEFVEKEDEETASSHVVWTVLQEWRTRIVRDSCNPLFGDQFSCSLQEEEELHRITLRMEVRDFDKFSRHVVLGQVRVPLGQHKITYPLELQEDLQTPQKDLVGHVLLSLKFLPTAQRLEVGLLKIVMLPTETHSDTALYARISVQFNQRKLRHQKTAAALRGQVTVFNQILMFPLPDFPTEEFESKILVSVYETHTNRKSSKHLIGQLTVEKGKSSEDQHWSLMMRSVRQPIAKWHNLFI